MRPQLVCHDTLPWLISFSLDAHDSRANLETTISLGGVGSLLGHSAVSSLSDARYSFRQCALCWWPSPLRDSRVATVRAFDRLCATPLRVGSFIISISTALDEHCSCDWHSHFHRLSTRSSIHRVYCYHPPHLTRRWSERRTAVRSTFEMTSTLPFRATRASVRRRSSCSR